MAAWTWAAAGCRGTSHEKTGERLQDVHSCFATPTGPNGTFVAIVSDGAGSARFGRQGAALTCRSIGVGIREHLRTAGTVPTENHLWTWVDSARDLISSVAKRRNISPREFSSTLVCAISNGSETLVAHVGDGGVVLKSDPSGEWIAPTWPEHGEYASTTSFVSDPAGVSLRCVQHEGRISALIAFSDGLERLGLDFVHAKPFGRFFDGLIRPVEAAATTGRNGPLSKKLWDFLNGEAVNSRTDDDKTLVVALRR